MNRTLNERETIIAIAESYKAVEESCLTKGLNGDAGSYTKMAKAWGDGTYAEFAWCLVKMHHEGRQYAYMGESWRTLRAQIVMYYINVERVQRWRSKVLKNKKGKWVKVDGDPVPYMHITRHKDAREQKALWGIDVVQMIWPRQKREPWLPTEVFQTVVDNKIAA